MKTPMKTHFIICNEADYLQAHLTFLVSTSRPGNPVVHDFKRRVTSVLKKRVVAGKADRSKLRGQPK
jgi:hypothetical protein